MESLYGLVSMVVVLVAGGCFILWLRFQRERFEASQVRLDPGPPSLPKAYADQILALEQRRLGIEERRVESESTRAGAAHELEVERLALEARKVALAEGQMSLQKERHTLELEMARERERGNGVPRGRHRSAADLERA